MKDTILMDALYNLRSDSGASEDYAKGIVVGIVSGLMYEKKHNFEEALKIIKENIQESKCIGGITCIRFNVIPESWRELFSKL